MAAIRGFLLQTVSGETVHERSSLAYLRFVTSSDQDSTGCTLETTATGICYCCHLVTISCNNTRVGVVLDQVYTCCTYGWMDGWMDGCATLSVIDRRQGQFEEISMPCSRPRDVSTLHVLYPIIIIHLYKHTRNTEPGEQDTYKTNATLEPANTITHKCHAPPPPHPNQHLRHITSLILQHLN